MKNIVGISFALLNQAEKLAVVHIYHSFPGASGVDMLVTSTRRKIAAAFAFSLFAASQSAYAVEYFSSSTIFQSETVYLPSYSNTTNRYIDVNSMSGESHVDFSTTDSFGFQTGAANASLSTGALRANATASGMDLANKSALTLTAISAFGDSFTLVDSDRSPFVTLGDLASFSLRITGLGGAGGATTFTPPRATAFLELFILNPGSVANWSPNNYGLISPNVDDIIQVFQWGATPESNSALDYSTYGTTYETHAIPVLNDGDMAVATFEVPSQFDWIARLNAGVFLPSGDPDAWASSDFSHTLNISFSGPSGALTESASGVFPGTVAVRTTVPEPATAMLAGLALTGLGLTRRRRQTGR